MSDIVHCIASLKTRESQGRFGDEHCDYLCMYIPEKDTGWRNIPVYKKGRPKPERVAWEYEERDGRLYLTPSLFCTDSQFHTSFAWDVAFSVCPDDRNGIEHVLALNPGIV